ncbi:MAG: amino acid adenylation domain-containing protein [Mailhella sp.]|nr:amino acid adenylation domain-containing protein [Mailhella sp.]
MQRIKNVAEWLHDSARRFPDKVAFSDGRFSYTYAELDEASRRIASELARRGLFKKPVLVLLDKEPRAIAAFMGCAYSGNFYVPVDLEMPRERLDKIREKLVPAAEISSGNFADFAESSLDENLLQDALSRQTDSDLLYVLYTSGSTGVPKGVALQHRAVIDYLDIVIRRFGFDEKLVHGQAVPFVFAGSLLPIYTTIACGGSNYLIPRTTLMFPAKTIDFLNKYRCNAIYWVPTSYGIIAKSGILDKRRPEYLEKCFFVGEIMSNSVLNAWRRRLPEPLYVNVMGPTEIAGTCVHYIVDRDFADDEPLPVGKPYGNVDVFLLDDSNRLCKNGETGEICLRGSILSCGYYNDPERTAQVFVQNPLNREYPETIYRTGDLGYWNERGELMFLGRRDFQIKHAGHRIELGEIEAAATSLEGVELCACVYDTAVPQIVLFYCGAAEAGDIRSGLKAKLQPYMIPGRMEKIGSMPRTASGKISRVALKELL